jgi:hypothetical protein
MSNRKVYTVQHLDAGTTDSDLVLLPVLNIGTLVHGGETLKHDQALFDQLKANFERGVPGGRIAIDRDHRADRIPRDSTAYGYIEGLEQHGDTLYARSKMNSRGRKSLADEEFDKTSAVYGTFTDGHGVKHENVLQGLSFTNRAADRSLPPVAAMLDDAVSDPLDALVQLATRPTDLPPDGWAGDAEPPEATKLDESAGAMLNDSTRHRELDATIRAAMRQAGSDDYVSTLEAFRTAYQDARESPGIGVASLSRVLSTTGVRKLEAFETDCRTLERRDVEVRRTLDAAMAPVRQERLDAQGRVALDDDFDLPRYRRDDEAQERDYLAVRRLDRAYEQRSAFDDANIAFAEAGLSLRKTIERPLALAQARQEAATVAMTLDEALRAGGTASERRKLLDAAIERLDGPSATVQPSVRAPGVRMLDGDEQQARDVAVAERLHELTAMQLDRALHLYLHDAVSLEAAAEAARREFPDTARPTAAPAPDEPVLDERAMLDQRVRAHAAEHQLSYADALDAVAAPVR